MDKFEAIFQLGKIWNDSRKPLQICAEEFFSRYPSFTNPEKSFIEELAYHNIKHLVYLKFYQEYLDKNKVLPAGIHGKLRELFVLLVHHESYGEAEEFLQLYAPDLVPDFRNYYLKVKFHFKKFEEDIISRSNFKKQIYVIYSYSRELIDLWIDQFSENYVKSLMEGLNQKPVISIRINSTRATRKDIRNTLEEYNIFTNPSGFSSTILNVKNVGVYELIQSVPYKEGLFLVQDEGEEILTQMVNLHHGEKVIVLNPSNSEFILSLAMQAPFRARIIAPCRTKTEVVQLVNKAKLFKVPNLDIEHIPSETELLKRYAGKVSQVIITPKTTGFGRLKVFPDRKWNLEKKTIFKLVDIQYKLLQLANELIPADGVITYISDTINLLENEKQINKFLLHFPQYKLIRDFEFQPGVLNKFIREDNSVFFHPKDVPFSSFYSVRLKKLS